MRRDLSTACINVPAKATLMEVRDLHDTYVTQKQASFYEKEIMEIQYPIIHFQEITYQKMKLIHLGRVRDMGKMIPLLGSNDDLFEYIGLCARMVEFSQVDREQNLY